MHERDPGSPGADGPDLPDPGTAGPANTPSFGGQPQDELASEGGRPPSHREWDEGRQGREQDDPYEGIAPAGQQREELQERARRVAESASERARDAFDRTGQRLDDEAERLADRLEGSAERLHARAERAESDTLRQWGERAAKAGESAAGYLRDADLDDLRSSLERQVRERPLQTLLIAAAAGWLIGKLVR